MLKKERKIAPKASWKTMFFANSGGLSSKRICGVLGWVICLGLFIASFVLEKEVPDFGDLVLITSTSLLGVDSVTSIFRKEVTKQQNFE